jgi:dolichol kinase
VGDSPAGASFEEIVAGTAGLQPWRRLFHLAGGSALAWILHGLSPESASAKWLVGGALAVAFMADLLRLRSVTLNRSFFRVFRPLLSPREVEGLSLTGFLLGVFLVLWFPEPTVVPAVLVLAISDPAASVVGRIWGRHPIGKGTLEGTAAFFATAAVVLIPFAGVAAALPIAAVAASVEALPTGRDDNIVIPAATAAGLWAASVL